MPNERAEGRKGLPCAFLWLTPLGHPYTHESGPKASGPSALPTVWDACLATEASIHLLVNVLRMSLALKANLCFPQALSCPPRAENDKKMARTASLGERYVEACREKQTAAEERAVKICLYPGMPEASAHLTDRGRWYWLPMVGSRAQGKGKR